MENEDGFEEPVRRRGGGPVSLVVTFVGLALCVYLLARERAALTYWFSSAEPIELGGPEQFRTEAAEDNRPARITGSAGKTAVRFELFGTHYEIVAIPGTNVLVRRERKDVVPARPGEPVPPPSPARFTAAGRLAVESSAPDYTGAFRTLVEVGEAVPQDGKLFILFDGELPGTGWRTPTYGVALALVALLNVAALVRYLRAVRTTSSED